MLLESDNDSDDNSVACTIKEWQKVAYQGDNISTFIYFCCSCSRFFDICSRLLLILKNISRMEMWISNVAKVFHRGFLNATRHIFYWICCLYLSFQRLYKVFCFTAEFSSKHVNYGIWLSFCTVMAVKTLDCVVIFTNIDTNWLVLIFIKFCV